MVKKLSQGNRYSYTYYKWICDDVEDISLIPESPMGSTVFVIHTKETYVIDSKKSWHLITSSNASSASSDKVLTLDNYILIDTNKLYSKVKNKNY